ncbi:hypothetical protein AUK10_04255 [Candidatus Gracilibacteria bacterium CG2_30_37_12]|nr:MAG: hypothetical protein AUK10_04255 [Candidatus Gracilibacteria bacterium CG2_30_37_12]
MSTPFDNRKIIVKEFGRQIIQELLDDNSNMETISTVAPSVISVETRKSVNDKSDREKIMDQLAIALNPKTPANK